MSEKFTELASKYGVVGAMVLIVALAAVAYVAGFDIDWIQSVLEQINAG